MNTIQYSTIQYNTIRYHTIQYNTIRYNTIQYNMIRYNTIQYNTIRDFLETEISSVAQCCVLCRTVLRASQKSFSSNDITYFFTVKHFLHSKHLIWKVLFFQNCFLRVALNRPGFSKSVYVRTYVREKLVVVQKYYVRYRTHETLIQCTSYFLFVTGYLLCFDQNKLKVSFAR